MTLEEARDLERSFKSLGALLIGSIIFLLGASALSFVGQLSAAQDERVWTAACTLAGEIASFRSEHLSPDALRRSPKPPFAAETPSVTQVFSDIGSASLGSHLSSTVAELQEVRRKTDLAFSDLNQAVPGDGGIAAAIAALGSLETSARSVALSSSYQHSCDSGKT